MVKLPGMRICIIGPKKSKASLRLKLAAESRGHICKRIKLIDIFFEIKDNRFIVNHRKLDLLDYDIYLFRTILPSENDEAVTLAKYLKQNGKIVIDNYLVDECLNDYEIFEKLSQESIPTINRIRTSGIKTARDVLMEFPHPILIKPLDESKERYTVSEDWTDSYDIVRTEKTKRFEIQELLNSEVYFRVYVVGNEIAGVLKKYVLEKDLRLNYAPKTRSEVYEITEQIKQIAIKSTSCLKYEIATIDMAYKNEDLVVLNIERAPKFKLFNKLFERKFEEIVIDYLEDKVKLNS